VGPSFLPAERLVPWLLVAGAIGVVLVVLSSRDRPAAAEDARREAERPGSDRQAR
jgi:hypothetical protein